LIVGYQKYLDICASDLNEYIFLEPEAKEANYDLCGFLVFKTLHFCTHDLGYKTSSLPWMQHLLTMRQTYNKFILLMKMFNESWLILYTPYSNITIDFFFLLKRQCKRVKKKRLTWFEFCTRKKSGLAFSYFSSFFFLSYIMSDGSIITVVLLFFSFLFRYKFFFQIFSSTCISNYYLFSIKLDLIK
jgi:hypothetical protein